MLVDRRLTISSDKKITCTRHHGLRSSRLALLRRELDVQLLEAAQIEVGHVAQLVLAGCEPEFLDAVPGDGKAPDEQLELAEAKAGLHVGLNELKPLDRETLEAFYLRGRSLKQMSREFETPIGTIKRRLHVARLRLKDVLEGQESDTIPSELDGKRTKRKERLAMSAV